MDFEFQHLHLGNYNSRGALICTGQYVDLYNKFFEPSISEYTQEYIMDYLSFDYHGVTADHESVLARPYASLMALMGELGYLGIITFVLLIFFLCKKKNADDLAACMEKFINMTKQEREEMGKAGHKKIVAEFEKNMVVEKVLAVILK